MLIISFLPVKLTDFFYHLFDHHSTQSEQFTVLIHNIGVIVRYYLILSSVVL